nr:MAG TPA: helix-turn-helix domain protein [Caudoviricetes sp.]
MFNNLAAEIARKGVKNNDFAEKVGIHPVTFSKKLNGKTDFTLKEVIRIIEYFNCEFTLEYLFEEKAV